MKWSKLKQIIESKICDALVKRISIYSTASVFCRHNRCPYHCGKVWITLDKREIISFTSGPLLDSFLENGENEWCYIYQDFYLRRDTHESLWKFTHELSLEEAIEIDNPLIQSLAILDKRLGKRRLNKILNDDLHPLSRKILKLRLGCTTVPIMQHILKDSCS